MSGLHRKTAPSAKTPRAEESKHSNYPASLDLSAGAAICAMHQAQRRLCSAGVWLLRGDVPAAVGAIEASRKALGGALDSLAGLVGSA